MTLLPRSLPAALPKKLERDVVDIVLVRTTVSVEQVAALYALLSAEEQAKAARLRIPAKRAERIVALAAVRTALSHVLGTQDYQLCYGPQGKPALVAPWNEVAFNVSHTAGLVVIAMTLGRPVGIDVESIRDALSYRELAERFFHPDEVAGILSLPAAQQRHAFFKVWTRKEAVLKATGHGLARGLATFSVSVASPPKVSCCDWPDVAAADFVIQDLPCGTAHCGSVAMIGSTFTLRRWTTID